MEMLEVARTGWTWMGTDGGIIKSREEGKIG